MYDCQFKKKLNSKLFTPLSTLVNESQVDPYIITINSQIDKFNLSIQRGIDSQTGDVHYALICISENRISKLASIYSAEQLEVLKAALELIITKNGRFRAKKIVKIMLNKNVKFPVMKDIFNTIEEFVRERYFSQDGDYFYIQPRGLIEFNMYFRTYYKDFVKECALCKQISIRSLKCKHCSTPYHKVCADRFSNQQDKCISCNNRFELNESIDSVRSEDATARIQEIADFLNADSGNEEESDNESLDEAMQVDHR